MKKYDSITKIISMSANDKKSLNLIYQFVKKHPHFKGERREIYKLIVKYKNLGGNK